MKKNYINLIAFLSIISSGLISACPLNLMNDSGQKVWIQSLLKADASKPDRKHTDPTELFSGATLQFPESAHQQINIFELKNVTAAAKAERCTRSLPPKCFPPCELQWVNTYFIEQTTCGADKTKPITIKLSDVIEAAQGDGKIQKVYRVEQKKSPYKNKNG